MCWSSITGYLRASAASIRHGWPDDCSIHNLVRRGPGDVVFIDFGSARFFRRAGVRFWMAVGVEFAKSEREAFMFEPALTAAFLSGYGFDLLPAWRKKIVMASWRFTRDTRRLRVKWRERWRSFRRRAVNSS